MIRVQGCGAVQGQCFAGLLAEAGDRLAVINLCIIDLFVQVISGQQTNTTDQLSICLLYTHIHIYIYIHMYV